MTKIIIAEDDPMISEIYQKKFSESGFEVLVASSGEQVLDLAKEKDTELILLDLIMPKMDGFEVIKKIREGQQYDSSIKIIVFSNLSQKDDREKALNLGANGFITKSQFTPSGLVEEVKRQTNQFSEETKNEMRDAGKEDGDKVTVKNGKKVLMIEDEEIFVEMFGEKLRQDGFEVDTATNGVLGLKKAFSGKYDIFIVDMILPGITGEEIVTKIKMEESIKNVPIMIFSASVDYDHEKKMKELGADEFFMKTQLIPSDLSKKVTEMLGI